MTDSENGLGSPVPPLNPAAESQASTPQVADDKPTAAPTPASGGGAAAAAAAAATPSSQPALSPANNRTKAASATRPPYVPQFSAATQMILKRMRGEPGGLGSALAAVTAPGAPRPSFPQPAYDSVRKRIIANIGSSSSSLVLNSSSSSSSSAAAAAAGPVSAANTLPLPTTKSRKALPSASSNRSLSSSLKRKRNALEESIEVSPLVGAPTYSEGIRKGTPRTAASTSTSTSTSSSTSTSTSTAVPPPPTITKSGRQILKPDTYDPAAEDKLKKRNQLGKRTTEQALCRKCTRMHSPATNQMVFCDGCNDPWHQRCHEPWIGDELVQDPAAKWYCAVCQAKRDRMMVKKKVVVEPPTLGSWAGQPADQKRVYLSGLSQADLVNLLMHATELHPELPIFPMPPTNPSSMAAASSSSASANAMPRSLYAQTSTEGLFSRAEANPTGPINFIRKIPANAKKSTMAKARSGPGSLQSKAAAQAQLIRASSGHQLLAEGEDASFTKLWPRPGKGMYNRLTPEAVDDRQLVDGNDYDAFSVIVYNEKGKKVEENGVKV